MRLKDIIGEFKSKPAQENNESKVNLAYIHYNASLDYISRNRLENAKRELKDAVREYPKFYDGYVLLALVFFASGNRIECLRTINMISDRDIHATAMRYYDLLSNENATIEDFQALKEEERPEPLVSVFPEDEKPYEPSPELEEKIRKFQTDFDRRFKTARHSVSGIKTSSIDFGDEFAEFLDDEEEIEETSDDQELFDDEVLETKEVDVPVEEEAHEEIKDELPEEKAAVIPIVEEPKVEQVEEPQENQTEESEEEPVEELEVEPIEEPVEEAKEEVQKEESANTDSLIQQQNAATILAENNKKENFFTALLKNKIFVMVAIIIICIVALVAVIIISSKLHKEVEEIIPTKRPTTAPTSTPYVTEVPTEEPTETVLTTPTEEPTQTPTPAPTEVPTPTPTVEPDERQLAEKATIAFNTLKRYYTQKKYYECAVFIDSYDFTYLPETLVDEKNNIVAKALPAFGSQYYNLTFEAVKNENWSDVVKYALPLTRYYPQHEKIYTIYFHLAKGYEFTGDVANAKKYYNYTIENFPDSKDAGYAKYRLSLLK